MKNFEAVKQMNAKQMAFMFCLMLKPFLDRFGEEEKKAVHAMIEAWLMQDVPEKKKG